MSQSKTPPQWAGDYQSIAEDIATWISDVKTRREIVSNVIAQVQLRIENRKAPPKKPKYWIALTVNTAFRSELDNRGIPRPNSLTVEHYELISALVKKRVPEDLEDGISNRSATATMRAPTQMPHGLRIVTTALTSQKPTSGPKKSLVSPLLLEIGGKGKGAFNKPIPLTPTTVLSATRMRAQRNDRTNANLRSSFPTVKAKEQLSSFF